MEKKYNAFISYRHSELDSKIAKEIQTQLERFRIPKAIRDRTGIKRFERIFRDKEELPITSDLNDDIDLALEQSDHLIVICSERTGESVWVQKEIETFLKYHEKKNVFTVLVDGEPEEVIPDILLHDTVTRKLPDGTEETREEFIEPLSCDYRLGIKKARKIELPRLAASMLGCSYDEIIQRRRQYIRRRNTMIGTVSAVFLAGIIGYLTWSLLQIKMNYDLAQANYQMAQDNLALAQANYEKSEENYMQALKNQSVYLASESLELLRADDRLGAVQLALAAMPSEGSDRPVTSEAEYALATSLGAYVSPGITDSDAVWKYGSGHPVEKFQIDEMSLRVAILDSEGELGVWSLADHSKLLTVREPGHIITDFMFDINGKLCVCFSDELRVYDKNLGSMLWNYALDKDHQNYMTSGKIQVMSKSTELMYSDAEHLMFFDLSDGSLKEEIDVENLSFDDEEPIGLRISQYALSDDSSTFAFDCSENFSGRGLYLFRRETGEWIKAESDYGFIGDMEFTPEGDKLIVSYEENVMDNSYVMAGIQVLNETSRVNAAIDTATGKEVWRGSVPHTLVGYGTDIRFVKYGEDKMSAVAVIFSNKAAVYDLEKGNELMCRELASEFIKSFSTSNATKLILILKNGQYSYLRLDDPDASMGSAAYFEANVEDTENFFSDDDYNHFLVQYDDFNYLIEYTGGFYDKDFVPVQGIGSVYVGRYLSVGDYLLVITSDSELICCDMTDGAVLWRTPAGGDNYSSIVFLGVDDEGNAYYKNTANYSEDLPSGVKVFRVTPSTGEITRLTSIPDIYDIRTDIVGGKMYFGFRNYMDEISSIYICDLKNDTVDTLDLSGKVPESPGACDMCVSPDGKYAIMSGYSEYYLGTYLVDLDSGETKLLYAEEVTFSAWNPKSDKYAVSTTSRAEVYDLAGKEIFAVESPNSNIISVFLGDNGMIVVLESGISWLYDWDGNLTATIDALMGNSISGVQNHDDVIFDYKDDTLILTIDEFASIIDMNEFKVRNLIAGFIGYSEKGGKYFTKVYGYREQFGAFGYCPIKSVDELIAEGYEYIGDEVMSIEMRKRYGIE